MTSPDIFYSLFLLQDTVNLSRHRQSFILVSFHLLLKRSVFNQGQISWTGLHLLSAENIKNTP